MVEVMAVTVVVGVKNDGAWEWTLNTNTKRNTLNKQSSAKAHTYTCKYTHYSYAYIEIDVHGAFVAMLRNEGVSVMTMGGLCRHRGGLETVLTGVWANCPNART